MRAPLPWAFALPAVLAACTVWQHGNASLPATSGARDIKTHDLVYITTWNQVWAYTLPGGVGAAYFNVRGAQNPCSDAAGDVYIPEYGPDNIVEYAHGGEHQIAVFADAGQTPASCGTDPTTGDLAVANYGTALTPGNIVVYSSPERAPRKYVDPGLYSYWFCAYDGSGNLYVDGSNRHGQTVLAELPKGGSVFTNTRISKWIRSPGSLQWDGQYMTIVDYVRHSIDRLVYSGHKLRVTGETHLNAWRAAPGQQVAIDGSTIVALPKRFTRAAGLWAYPAGGNPTKILKRLISVKLYIDGVTVSVAP